jgi:hypothetical protein
MVACGVRRLSTSTLDVHLERLVDEVCAPLAVSYEVDQDGDDAIADTLEVRWCIEQRGPGRAQLLGDGAVVGRDLLDPPGEAGRAGHDLREEPIGTFGRGDVTGKGALERGELVGQLATPGTIPTGCRAREGGLDARDRRAYAGTLGSGLRERAPMPWRRRGLAAWIQRSRSFVGLTIHAASSPAMANGRT